MRRKWLWLAVGVFVGMLACGAPASGPGPAPAAGGSVPAGAPTVEVEGASDPVILAGSQNVTTNVYLWLAHDLGLFEQHGVAVDLQNINAINAIKALVAGQLHGVVIGSPEVIAARASGTALTVVAVYAPVYNQIMVVAPDVTAAEQLRGRTVGVITNTSINGVGTVSALKRFGLEPVRDYELVETGVAGVYTGLTNNLLIGNVHAALLEPGFARHAVAAGHRELFDQAVLGTPVASSALTFHTDYLHANRSRIQKIVAALIASVRYAQGHRAETQAVLAKYYRIDDPAELERTYDRVVLQVLSATPYPAIEQFPDTIEAMAREYPEVRALDLNSLVDRSLVEDALRTQ